MATFIRIIHHLKYIPKLGRFGSNVFANLKGGISIVDLDCVRETGRSACGHVKKYYPSAIPSPKPPILWIFNSEILPSSCKVEREMSTTGDVCHYNIKELSNNQAKKVFSRSVKSLDDLKICENDHYRTLTREDIPTAT